MRASRGCEVPYSHRGHDLEGRMTERSDGVFACGSIRMIWQHDEEMGGLVHLLRFDDQVQAGLWKPGPVSGCVIELELASIAPVFV